MKNLIHHSLLCFFHIIPISELVIDVCKVSTKFYRANAFYQNNIAFSLIFLSFNFFSVLGYAFTQLKILHQIH